MSDGSTPFVSYLVIIGILSWFLLPNFYKSKRLARFDTVNMLKCNAPTLIAKAYNIIS